MGFGLNQDLLPVKVIYVTFCVVCNCFYNITYLQHEIFQRFMISDICQPHRATSFSSSQLPPLSLLSCQSLLNSLASVPLEWALFLQVKTHKMTSKQLRQAPKKSSLQSHHSAALWWDGRKANCWLVGWLSWSTTHCFSSCSSLHRCHTSFCIWLISNYQNLAGLFYFSIQLVSSIDGDFSATFECSQPQSLLKVLFMLKTFLWLPSF